MPDYLVASDFDQTLSYNDSGIVLSEILGVREFQERSRDSPRSAWCIKARNCVLLRHDPEFRKVRREHLVEAGKRTP